MIETVLQGSDEDSGLLYTQHAVTGALNAHSAS